jgi:hypothetical protein
MASPRSSQTPTSPKKGLFSNLATGLVDKLDSKGALGTFAAKGLKTAAAGVSGAAGMVADKMVETKTNFGLTNYAISNISNCTDKMVEVRYHDSTWTDSGEKANDDKYLRIPPMSSRDARDIYETGFSRRKECFGMGNIPVGDEHDLHRRCLEISVGGIVAFYVFRDKRDKHHHQVCFSKVNDGGILARLRNSSFGKCEELSKREKELSKEYFDKKIVLHEFSTIKDLMELFAFTVLPDSIEVGNSVNNGRPLSQGITINTDNTQLEVDGHGSYAGNMKAGAGGGAMLGAVAGPLAGAAGAMAGGAAAAAKTKADVAMGHYASAELRCPTPLERTNITGIGSLYPEHEFCALLSSLAYDVTELGGLRVGDKVKFRRRGDVKMMSTSGTIHAVGAGVYDVAFVDSKAGATIERDVLSDQIQKKDEDDMGAQVRSCHAQHTRPCPDPVLAVLHCVP